MAAKKDLVQEAWHHVDRLGAEKILNHKSRGSFLFRKDEYAVRLEEQLNSNLEEKVTCLTLSYLQSPEHVVDRTLIFKQHRWSFYDDDTHLHGRSYETIDDLLKHVDTDLNHPILRRAS
jgi:hypothetical protein